MINEQHPGALQQQSAPLSYHETSIADIHWLGVSFHTNSLDQRAILALTPEEYATLGEKLSSQFPQNVILSTCNRTEFYFQTPTHNNNQRSRSDNFSKIIKDQADVFKSYIQVIADFKKLPFNQIESMLLKKSGNDVIHHAHLVASSLDSMVIGENQILSQLRQAYEIARARKSTRNTLNKLFQSAIHTGKKIRHETNISVGAVSIGSAAAEITKEIFDKKAHCKVLVIGAGDMAQICARNLSRVIQPTFTVANRTSAKAMEFAHKFHGKAIPFEDRYLYLDEADIIIACTSAGQYLIDHGNTSKVLLHNKKLKLFIDLSVPRNIDPHVEDHDNIVLYAIDDLKKSIEINNKNRVQESNHAHTIINNEVDNFNEWVLKKNIIQLWHTKAKRIEFALIEKHQIKLENQLSILSDESNLFFKRHVKKNIKHMIKVLKHDQLFEKLNSPLSELQLELIENMLRDMESNLSQRLEKIISE